ncbi:MAG: type II secretion system major pseudopilin GspG [Cocleimonas sp.]
MKSMSKSRVSSSKSQGFTLLEVMVVVVIIVVMAAAIGPSMLGNIEKASISRAGTDIKSIESMLELYKAENYAYPSTDQGLEALVAKPSGDPAPKNWRQYMKKTPVDPWKNPYKYLSPGSHGDIDIYSFGPDGVQGDDDVGNWQLDN